MQVDMRKNEYKIKLLVLWDILCRFTDEEHPMNTDEIIEKLNEKGIASSRKVLVADIALLNENGYTVLDIVFDGQMEAELIVTPFEIKDVKGKTIKGNTYSVRSYDEDGTVYECPIKPARTSDKSFLNMLLR